MQQLNRQLWKLEQPLNHQKSLQQPQHQTSIQLGTTQLTTTLTKKHHHQTQQTNYFQTKIAHNPNNVKTSKSQEIHIFLTNSNYTPLTEKQNFTTQTAQSQQ